MQCGRPEKVWPRVKHLLSACVSCHLTITMLSAAVISTQVITWWPCGVHMCYITADFFFESLWQSSVVNRLKYLDRTPCATLPNTFTCTRKSEQSASLPKLGSFRFLTRNVVKEHAIFGTLCALLMNLLHVELRERPEHHLCVGIA